MIQALKAKKSKNSLRAHSGYHFYAVEAKQSVDLSEEDLSLLNALSKSTTSCGSELDLSFDGMKMVLTKMNDDNAPTEVEADAIFRIADIQSPHDKLTVEELEAAMRFWRMIIPNRDKINLNFDSIYFGHTHEDHVNSVRDFYVNMGLDGNRLSNSEIERMLSLMKIGEEDGVVDRESAFPLIIMEYIIQTLEIYEERRQTILDGFLNDDDDGGGGASDNQEGVKVIEVQEEQKSDNKDKEDNAKPEKQQSPQQQLPQQQQQQAEDKESVVSEVPVSSSKPCCVLC